MTAQVIVELLLVPECPHADAARTLLTRCLEETGLAVAVVERVGDYPSPTIAVNGVDVMTGTQTTPGVAACRLDVPTAPPVLQALRRATSTGDPAPQKQSSLYPAELAVGVTRERIAAVTPAARAVHRAILHGFAATGKAPDRDDLTAAGRDLDALMAKLHEQDVVRLDADGAVRAAYPFSGVPTAHTVAIDGGPSVYAMCAIDALGIADMLGRDITISSSDPVSGQEIRVEIGGGRATWSPDATVVFVGSNAATSADGDCCRPESGQLDAIAAADRCCTTMNFFTSTDTAHAWQAAHPDVSGVILNKGQAVQLGVDIFGHLLDE